MNTPSDMLRGLESCLYFRGFPVDQLHSIAVHSEYQRLRSKTVIASRGDEADACWVLVAGHVEVWRPGEDGEPVVRAILRPGMILGHTELLEDRPRSATWVAQGQVHLLRFSREHFEGLVEDTTLVGSIFRRALILAQSNQLHAANRRLRQVVAAVGRERQA